MVRDAVQGAGLFGDWQTGNSPMIGRLRDESWNALYVAAYLRVLRDHHDDGASATEVYGQTVPGIGEYNSTPKFVSAFGMAQAHYSHLDYDDSWGSDQSVELERGSPPLISLPFVGLFG